MKLSKRLLMAASFVRKGSVIADIGTDHAYLPVYLIQNDICNKAYAADIGKGPLLNAKETVRRYCLEDKITLILSDGLKNIDLDVTDTVILAGMGGDLISGILSCADIEKLKRIHVIAQPQSHSEKVRAFFMNNGFEIEKEEICRDSKHTYICMSAFYTSKTVFPDSYEYYGELIKNKSELVKPYFEKQLKNMEMKKNALFKADIDSSQAKKLSLIIDNIRNEIGEK